MNIQDKSITFGNNVLAPAAWIVFAGEHPEQSIASTPTELEDTNELMDALTEINEQVNNAIIQKLDAESWQLWPKQGNCTDYVVTKREALLARGYPSSCLLIAEVRTPEDEPHAVLVVRTSSGDYVLDNRNPMIYLWHSVGYQWVRVQSPDNPNLWKTVVSC